MAKNFDKHKKNVILNLIQNLFYRFRLAGRNDRGKYFQSPPLAGGEVKERGIKPAFTLAEVLITLGIIGVVAAMTIPTLMTNYAKKRTETQLVKFYSMMNQTLRMSVAENGEPDGWITRNKMYTYEENVEFLKTYISPYLKHYEYYDCGRISTQEPVCIKFNDGSLVKFKITRYGGDIFLYLDGNVNNTTQKNFFAFQLGKYAESNVETISMPNYMTPYTFRWDGTREDLMMGSFGCNLQNVSHAYCTKLIEMNSWKIPSDYPW